MSDDQPCCGYGPDGHSQQQHHDASACFDSTCRFDHPLGGPFPHPCDREVKPLTGPAIRKLWAALCYVGRAMVARAWRNYR